MGANTRRLPRPTTTYYKAVGDAMSKWPEIFKLNNIKAGTTVKLLKELFARYGNPKTLVSGNGTQFTSDKGRILGGRGHS
ncbi:hypothetical protein Y032_0090g2376 [Ancylostoma ceylanicum]|uniref:Integrase catalytic domain-containing protein n=1 Tax=Ancylostoma ceylanicum TaxID=53326 RepID=A0A016TMV3_9BILA|nr:hypothetical protein Y032_0090g2376 [Ancylostoma ceylanicum]